jgi:hypothetical protein
MDKCTAHEKSIDDISEISKNFALLQRDVEYLRRDQETILARFGKHIEDAEKSGGRHERLKAVEDSIAEMKRSNPIIMLGCGIIGGFIGAGAPATITSLFHAMGLR